MRLLPYAPRAGAARGAQIDAVLGLLALRLNGLDSEQRSAEEIRRALTL